MLGIFCAFLFVSAISVYIFHDVDKDMIGHWNEAFSGLCIEGILFTMIIGGGAALLTSLARLLFRLKGCSPRSRLAFFLGIGITVLQYPWDLIGRIAFPNLADSFLSFYLIAAIVFCTVVIVRDNFKQMKLRQASAVQFDS